MMFMFLNAVVVQASDAAQPLDTSKEPSKEPMTKFGRKYKAKRSLLRALLEIRSERRKQSVELSLSERLGLTLTSEAVVGRAEDGSQAHLSGLHPGSRILTIGGWEMPY